jgi:hypothetical protein
MPTLSSWFFPFGVSNSNFVWIFFPPCMPHDLANSLLDLIILIAFGGD